MSDPNGDSLITHLKPKLTYTKPCTISKADMDAIKTQSDLVGSESYGRIKMEINYNPLAIIFQHSNAFQNSL